jgi:regulator of sirC expression with transglutaminase-like and TPR domain
MPGISENKKLAALINLLDEPDENAFRAVEEKICLFGKDAIALLEQAWENTFDPLIQERITSILKKIRQDIAGSDFSAWLMFGSSDLLKGFLIVNRVLQPETNEEALTIRVEQMKMDIWLEMNENMTALENIKVINHVFYGIQKFEADKVNPNALQNFFLDSILETRKGSPLTLGMLYMLLAQKLKMPVFGVNLPRHFILAYLEDFESFGELEDRNILFYINPFSKGSVFTRREIELFIRQLGLKADMSYFNPSTNADIIRQLINTLVFLYNRSDMPEKTELLENLIRIMDTH